jgi:hypothetical protein
VRVDGVGLLRECLKAVDLQFKMFFFV